jgi:hypothetical protein
MDTTIPTPFHKYLYSGAYYVQVGQCYAVVSRLYREGFDLETDEEVRLEIIGLWNNFVESQLAVWMKAANESKESARTSQLEQIDKLGTEISNIGINITRDFIARLNEQGFEQMQLDTFFTIWAQTCSESYAAFIRSDNVSRLLASTLNTVLEQRLQH